MSTHKNYLVGVLLLILASNFVDRLAFGLFLQDIKVDLDLTDTQLGFLTGFAFALFYSVMGIPLARWADRGNRVTIIALTTALWSAAVALCGLAGNFLHLLMLRVGVAVGEAGCIPPAHSLIADHFNRAERPRAVARYLLGAPLSTIFGYFLAGWLNEFYGWRVTFMLLGLPGLALAVLAWLTLRDPRRGELTRKGDRRFTAVPQSQPDPPELSAAAPGVKEVCIMLWANATFRHLLLAFSVIFFFGYGMGQWQAAFFIRSYGLETGELGTWFAVIYGLSMLLGTYLGGELASRYAVHNERLQLRAMAVAFASCSVISAGVYLSPNHYLAFGLLGLTTLSSSITAGPLFATIQTLVPDRMRALSIAMIYLFANLIGMGLGPLAAGALSDALRPLFGEESLRYALTVLCPGYLWATWHLWHGSKTVTSDTQAVQRAEQCLGREDHSALGLSVEPASARSE